MQATEAFFYSKNGFPGIRGVVDGTEIETRNKKVDGEAYINRKKYSSVNTQVNIHYYFKLIKI